MKMSAKIARRVEAGERPARTPRETKRRGVVNSQSMYPASQPKSAEHPRFQRTSIVDLSEEVDVVRVVVSKLGRNVRNTETSSHGKVRDHRDREDHSREPSLSAYVGDE